MWICATIPFCLQAIAILIDEIYFHHKRGLPRWERIGHPLDTFSFLICLAITIWIPFDSDSLKIYVGLSILSCLMLTKDEFIHKDHCPGAENWLHALLFILHPLTLILAGMMWAACEGNDAPLWLTPLLMHATTLKSFLWIQTLAITAFFFYQLIYWNFLWKNQQVLKF